MTLKAWTAGVVSALLLVLVPWALILLLSGRMAALVLPLAGIGAVVLASLLMWY